MRIFFAILLLINSAFIYAQELNDVVHIASFQAQSPDQGEVSFRSSKSFSAGETLSVGSGYILYDTNGSFIKDSTSASGVAVYSSPVVSTGNYRLQAGEKVSILPGTSFNNGVTLKVTTDSEIESQRVSNNNREPSFEKGIPSVYPNPFSDKLYLNNSANVQKIEVFDLRGLVFKPNSYSDESKAIEFSTDLPTGVYILKVTTNDNMINRYNILKK